MLTSKQTEMNKMAIIEVGSIVLFLLVLVLNIHKTNKMSALYDELNLTASDYTVFINVSAGHRYDFNQIYGSKLTDDSKYSRGYYFKKYITDKMVF
jgi:hypothetical protein